MFMAIVTSHTRISISTMVHADCPAASIGNDTGIRIYMDVSRRRNHSLSIHMLSMPERTRRALRHPRRR